MAQPKKTRDSIGFNDNQDPLLHSLVSRIKYLDLPKQELVVKAYSFANEKHEKQLVRSGDRYIHHLVNVAILLADARMDAEGIACALLQDTLLDTETTIDDINKAFTTEIGSLCHELNEVDEEVLGDKAFEAMDEASLQYNQTITISNDIRIVLIKLMKRLVNMRILGVMSPSRRLEISKDTLNVYVPIAHLLGLEKIRRELEDICFQTRHPFRYRALDNALKAVASTQKATLENLSSTIAENLKSEKLTFRIHPNERTPFGVYQQMLRRRRSFTDMSVEISICIVLKCNTNCYQVLGLLHSLFKPLPWTFKDYIAIPKANGYQSLHTTLQTSEARLKVQIRTEEMDSVANLGIVSKWISAYKGDEESRNYIANLQENARANDSNSAENSSQFRSKQHGNVIYINIPGVAERQKELSEELQKTFQLSASNQEELFKILLDIRKKNKISQKEVAKFIGSSAPRVGRVERGEDRCTIDWAKKYASAIGVELALCIDPPK